MQRIAESCSLDPLFALSIERGGDSALTGVLDSANLQGLSAISTIDTYAGLGLDSQIDDLVAEIKAQPR